MAASIRDCPSDMCTVMFSTITIASSITTPIEAATPPSVIRLKLIWNSFMNTIAISTATGITTAATTVVRQLFRNPSSTATDSASPIRMLSRTLAIESRTSTDWS